MDGILVANKPAGPTSHDVVALVRRLASTKRVGHGGTLDPFASGVLPLYLGRATKVVEYHLGDGKGYRATVCFGASSVTDDLEGDLTPAGGPAPTREAVEGALSTFMGEISQRPPAYSAVKVAGRRAYAMARAGESVELADRRVTIHGLDLLSWDGSDASRPIAVLDVRCSAGTYIRALARDLGAAVGSAAYLGALTRTASGSFTLDVAISLDDLRSAAADGPERLAGLLLPVDAGLDELQEVVVTGADVAAVARGQFVRAHAVLDDGPIRVRDARGTLVAIARFRDGRLAPDKVLVDAPAPEAAVPDGEPVTIGGVDGLRTGDGPIFAVIGVFDGIHLGHRYLLRHLVFEAERRAARATVITFDSHPDEVILGAAPPLLLDPVDRLRLLGESGVDVVVVQHFDAALRATEYDEFIHRITSRTRLSGLLMTPDAAFGHDRRGTPETVGELAAHDGFDLIVVPPFEIDRRSVRSSDIRAAIAAGELAEAARLLGRPYSVVGTTAADDGGVTRVSFAPPRALPPDGGWPAVVAPWPAVPGGPSGTETTVFVTSGSIVVDGAPPAAAVGITFLAP